MNYNFNEESLNKLGIFELRNLAREIGVYSPTIYRKKEIVEKIMSIVNGETKPHVSKTKQGRPPKSINGVNNILDIFIPKEQKQEEVFYKPSTSNALSNLTANQNNYGLNYSAEEGVEKQGILKVFKEGYGFCYENGYHSRNKSANYFVSNGFINKYELRSGDVLTGLTKLVSDDKPMVMYTVTKINSVSVNEYNPSRKDINNAQIVHPNKVIEREYNNVINSLYMKYFVPIGYGQRLMVNVPKNLDYSTMITNYLNSIRKTNKDIEISCVLINERPEDITEYKESLKDINTVSTTFEYSPEQSIQKIELEIERLKRLVEEGKNVLVVLSNLNRLRMLYKEANNINGSSSQEGDIKSRMLIKKLLTYARNTKDMGTMTILSLIEEANDEFENGIKELCNSQLYVNETNYFKKDKIWFDISKSKTRKSHLLLSEEELNFANEFMQNLTNENKNLKVLELEEKLLKL